MIFRTCTHAIHVYKVSPQLREEVGQGMYTSLPEILWDTLAPYGLLYHGLVG